MGARVTGGARRRYSSRGRGSGTDAPVSVGLLVEKRSSGGVVRAMGASAGRSLAGRCSRALSAAVPGGRDDHAADRTTARGRLARRAGDRPLRLPHRLGDLHRCADAVRARRSLPRSQERAPEPSRSRAPSFLVLSTGDAMQADQPDQPGVFPSTDDGSGCVSAAHGDSAYDATVLQIPFNNPVDAAGGPVTACVSFDFRFLSEEYPTASRQPVQRRLHRRARQRQPAMDDVRLGHLGAEQLRGAAGRPAADDQVGRPRARCRRRAAAGTPYGAATALLRAQVIVDPRRPATGHSLFLSIFDHGDRRRRQRGLHRQPHDQPPAGTCATGRDLPGPAVAITGPSVAATVDTPTPTLTGTATGAGNVTARIYAGCLRRRRAGADAAGHAHRATVVRDGAAALAPANTPPRPRRANAGGHGVSAPATFTVAAPPYPSRQGGGASSSSPATATATGSPTTRTRRTARCRRSPARRSTRAWSPATSTSSTRPARGRGRSTPPKGFVPLKGAANVPMGSQLDTRSGRVAVTSAADTGGAKTQTADFYDGIFQVKQALPKKTPAKPAALITDLVLKGEPAAVGVRAAEGRGLRARRPRRRSAARSRCWARCGATARASSARTASTARPPCAARSG